MSPVEIDTYRRFAERRFSGRSNSKYGGSAFAGTIGAHDEPSAGGETVKSPKVDSSRAGCAVLRVG